jgi:hypothetical protein
MSAMSVAVRPEETGTGVSGVKSTGRRSQRRRNHWIVLDSAWAKLLGVRKTAGVYQIRSNELQFRLFLMQEAPGSSVPTPTGPPTHEEIVLVHNLEVLAASGGVIAASGDPQGVGERRQRLALHPRLVEEAPRAAPRGIGK